MAKIAQSADWSVGETWFFQLSDSGMIYATALIYSLSCDCRQKH